MADITLKAYLAHLDDLLGRRLYEEAEAHCTHILAKFPKNLQTLRRLAKAQFESGRYPEAEKTYTKVLSMEPRSIDAYVGLSWVARQRGQGDQTIALLERAYEQDTNNQDVIQLLRDAHRTFNDHNNPKLPQTQFIAARQQWRSGLGQQAIATLNAALAQDPARADIRLLKMQIHQQSGDGIEAARAATDTLKQLPDCVEANAMLAQFWKAQGRPSDAQRFVSHVEAADPFLAFEIATGAPPPDEALSLSLFNYRASASPALSTEAPDWLGELGKNEPTQMTMPVVNVEPEATSMDWLDNAVVEEEKSDDIGWLKDAVDTSGLPEDLNWLSEAAAADTANDANDDEFNFEAEFGVTDEAAPMPDMSIDWVDDAEAADEGDTLDSISTRIAQEEAKRQEVYEELAAMSDEETPSNTGTTQLPSEDDWMAALNSVSDDATTPERDDFDDFLKNFTSFSEITAEEESQSSGTGLTGLLSTPDSSEAEAPRPADISDIDPEDPLAWMRAGVNDDAQMPDLDALLSDEAFGSDEPAPQAVASDGPDEDPFAWMKDHDVEMADDAAEQSLWDDPMGVEEMVSIDPTEADPMQWMRNEGIEFVEEADPEADPLAWAKESGVDLLDDVGSANITQTASVDLEWASQAAQGEAQPTDDAPEDTDLHVSELKTGVLPSFDAIMPNNQGDSSMSDQQQPDWLSSMNDNDNQPGAEQGDDFDWMSATPASNTDDIDWDAAPDVESADEAAPDWLAALENPVDAAEAAALSATDDPSITDMWDDAVDDATAQPEWMAVLRDESAADENPDASPADWLFEEGQPTKDEIAADDILASGVPNTDEAAWLNDIAPAAAADASAGGSEWQSASASDDDDDNSAAASSDASLDWLDAVVPSAASDEPAAANTGEDIDWLDAPIDQNAQPVAEADDEDTLDWLNAVTPADAANAASAAETAVEAAADASAAATSDLSLDDWLRDASADAGEAAADAIEAASADVAPDLSLDDWLRDASADAGDAAADAVEDAQDALAAATDDGGLMDWLQAAAPEPENEPLAAAAATSMDWLDMDSDDDGIGDETNAFIAQDSLDWLTEAPADAASEAADDAVSPEFIGSDAPSDSDFNFDAAEALADAPPYELSYIEDDESTEDVQTVELEGDPLPDRLVETRSESAPLDVDVPQEQLQIQNELSGEILDDADLLEAEPPVQETLSASAVNSPDWLNAMVPGLDVGSDLPEDEHDHAAENEFLNGGRSDFGWLSNIVDEELAPPAMPAPSRRAARFPFSEPPVWLTMLREETQVTPTIMDLDNDDDSLPDWLKFDDAETK